MTKLKPISDEKALAAIPTTEPVLVELPAMPTGEDLGAGTGIKEPPARVEKAEDEPADDGATKLKEQMAALQRANAAEKARADKAERDAAEARRIANERDVENKRLQAGRVEDEGSLIQNALAAAQADERAARAAYEQAFEEGDKKGAADAQSKIARSAAKIVQHENAAAVHAAEQERIAKAPKVEERRDGPGVHTDPIAAIEAAPQLLPTEKAWLKAHPDAWTDPQKNQELAVAYNRSMRVPGMVRGTPEQFKYIEEFMGYAQTSWSATNDSGGSLVSAPVSRDTGSSISGKPISNSRVELTPDQRSLARSMGLSDVQYARQVLRLQQAKKDEPEKYAVRAS